MAETTHMEREYTVPLREVWMKKASYKRTRKAVMELKTFIARHMKVPGHDIEKVKLDVYLNNQMWHRGSSKPPASIKVKARKDGEIVHVTLAHAPAFLAFTKDKHARLHKKAAKKEVKTDEKKEQTVEEKKVESEKEQSVAIANEKMAEKAAKAEKHTTPVKTPKINRMALKK